MEYVTIQFSSLRLLDYLPCFVESLQGEQIVAEIFVRGGIIRVKADVFAIRMRRLLILPLLAVYEAEVRICGALSRVARNYLLKGCAASPVARYILIVVSRNSQFFRSLACSRNSNALL